MKRFRAVRLIVALVVAGGLGAPAAAAQGGPLDAEPPTGLAPLASAAPMIGAAPSASADTRPARGPAVRERGGRRTRAGSSATGFLMLAILVGLMGYYVVKKIRRY